MIKNGQSSSPSLMQPKYLIPAMIFVAFLMIGLRLEDMWVATTTGKPFHAVARTQAEPAPEAEKAAPKTGGDTKAETPGIAAPAESQQAKSRSEVETDVSILKQLKDRRDQLDQRLRDVDTREALIRVAEQRVDQKIKEMEALRAQLQTMVNQANVGQQAQLDNLVKIYETMKAKEAAKIFEQLEMPTLLGVIERMKPARVAVIMAEMAPEKAKEITVALTKKDQLPQIK